MCPGNVHARQDVRCRSFKGNSPVRLRRRYRLIIPTVVPGRWARVMLLTLAIAGRRRLQGPVAVAHPSEKRGGETEHKTR